MYNQSLYRHTVAYITPINVKKCFEYNTSSDSHALVCVHRLLPCIPWEVHYSISPSVLPINKPFRELQDWEEEFMAMENPHNAIFLCTMYSIPMIFPAINQEFLGISHSSSWVHQPRAVCWSPTSGWSSKCPKAPWRTSWLGNSIGKLGELGGWKQDGRVTHPDSFI